MQYCDGFCHQHESAAFMLASGHAGPEIKICTAVSDTALLSKAQGSTDTWTGCTHGTTCARHELAYMIGRERARPCP